MLLVRLNNVFVMKRVMKIDKLEINPKFMRLPWRLRTGECFHCEGKEVGKMQREL